MRKVSYLCAKKSFDRLTVGTFAKALNAIPVVRPQDLTKRGTGAITLKSSPSSSSSSSILLHGTPDTLFTSQLKPRSTITFIMTPSSPTAFTITAEVVEVVSDTEVYVKNFTSEQEPDTSKLFREMMGAPGYPFKITPHIDQAAMFSAVYEKLAQRECIGIFPEGGSHDRAEFLPLKPGFAIMALGAMEKYSGLDVKIVPVGL